MKKDLEVILESLALCAATLCVACGGDDNSDDAPGASDGAGTDAGCPGTSAGCPGTSSGCPGTSSGCPGTTAGCPGSEPDAEAILARAADFETELTRVNAEPSGSAHGLADTVNQWVEPASADDYRRLLPDGSVTDVVFPEGTLIVKEHLNADGEYDGFLTMYKAAPGYNPDADDWWWARVGGDGTVFETGQVGFCMDCHRQVEDAGFVFGIPADNQN